MEKSESAIAKLAEAAQVAGNTEDDESELPKVNSLQFSSTNIVQVLLGL